MIPISRITVLNPRARNKRQHREIVNNIEAIGLKRPITVSRHDGPGGRATIWSAAKAGSKPSRCWARPRFRRW
jgi:hypothetical protein